MKKTRKRVTRKTTPKGEKMQKVIPIALTDKDRDVRSRRIAKLEIEQRQVEEEKKETTAQFNARIKTLRKEIGEISCEIEAGYKEENVSVVMVKDFPNNEVQYWYKGEVAETREMTESDRQMDLADAKPTTKRKTRKKKKTAKKPQLKVADNQPSENVMVQ